MSNDEECLPLNKIYNMDCLLGLDKIQDESIDLLLTDPPYNISQPSRFHTMKGRTGVDFGEWDVSFNQTEWLSKACDKICKGGSAVVFNSYANIQQMTDVFKSKGFTVKQMLIWKKSNPMPRNRDRLYVTSFEVALWAVKGKGWTFNRQKDTYENGIFEYPTVHASKRTHPTQKPLDLITDLMKIHSNEGDVVLDCFMGSGTTAKAAFQNHRQFIGFELDKDFYQTATAEIDEMMNQMNLFDI